MKTIIYKQIVAREGIMDSSNEIFEEGAIRFDRPEVPIILNNDKKDHVGRTTLFREGSNIVAEIAIWEDILPEILAKLLTPSITGYVKQRDEENPKIIVTAHVTHVSLDGYGNVDYDIKKLGES